MKRLARYWINHEIKWITASGVMMGIALFAQALYYFAFTPLQAVGTAELILQLILPMAMEVVWCILLRGVKLKRAFAFGILGAVCCLLLIVQSCFAGDTFRMILSIIMYLIGGLFLVMILGGFFPYRLFGFVAFAAISCLRFLFFDFIGILVCQDWMVLLQELPGLCMTLALWFVFGGIRATRIK